MPRWSGQYMLDPVDIETRFSNEQSLASLDSVFTEPDEENLILMERVEEIMETLPAREADFIDLYFFRHLKQTAIAMIFNVSQPTVCYRLQRATARIQFILQLPRIEISLLKMDLQGFLSDPLDVDIMLYMYKTTCQSEVAKRLGVSQGLVRHRFIRTIKRMGENEKMLFYADLFQNIAGNLNILREVQRIPNGDQISHYLD
jgi:DNA-directed RNA polymerase specialized sigma24 family protein